MFSFFSPAASGNLHFCKDLSCCDLHSVDLAILAPDIPERMLSIAEHMIRENVSYLFDPGQAISALSKEYLGIIIEGCVGIIANEYETSLLEEKMRMTLPQITKWAGFFVKTLGENGCALYEGKKQKNIPAIKGLQVADITGCGDAFRSGFLHGYVDKKSLEDCCKIACVSASFVIDKIGTQTHSFTGDDFTARLKKFYKD